VNGTGIEHARSVFPSLSRASLGRRPALGAGASSSRTMPGERREVLQCQPTLGARPNEPRTLLRGQAHRSATALLQATNSVNPHLCEPYGETCVAGPLRRRNRLRETPEPKPWPPPSPHPDAFVVTDRPLGAWVRSDVPSAIWVVSRSEERGTTRRLSPPRSRGSSPLSRRARRTGRETPILTPHQRDP